MKIPKNFEKGKSDCEYCGRTGIRCKIITCDMDCYHYVCEWCLRNNLEIINLLKKPKKKLEGKCQE